MKRAADAILNSELIVRYLLGESLSEGDQAEIERRLFGDDGFLEEIQAIEFQLMARYLRNDFSPRERELFESHFLLSPERRNALEFVRGLSNALDSGEEPHEAESETHETSLNRSRDFPSIAILGGFAARRMRVAALSMAAVLFVGVMLWSFRAEHTRRPSQPRPGSVNVKTMPAVLPGAVAISPDGQYVASLAQSGGKSAIWIRRISDVQPRLLAGTENGTSPFWSPDSRYIAFVADGKLKTISIAGGPARTLAEAVPLPGAWSRDGSILFSVGQIGSSEIARISESGGAATPVGTHRDGYGDLLPQFLPDGRHFLYVSNTGPAGGAELYAGSVDGGTPVHIMSSGAVNSVIGSPPRYAEPGYLLFIRNGTLIAQRFDAERLTLIGAPVAIAEHAGPFSVSRQQTLVYQTVSAQVTVPIWIDRIGNRGPYVWQQELFPMQLQGIFHSLRLSPDGLRLAVDQTMDGNRGIWVIDLDRKMSKRLTFAFDASTNFNPIWSPDGRQIVFSSSRVGPFRMFIRSSVSGGTDQPLPSETPSGMQDVAENWSPDGKYIVFVRYSAPGADIWLKPLWGDKKPLPYILSKSMKLEPRVSPNGRWLAYTTNESGTFQIVVQSFPDPTSSKVIVSARGGIYPNWRRDGRELYYVALDGKLMAVPVKAGGDDLIFDLPTVLFQSPLTIPSFPGASAYDVSADGMRFVFLDNTANPNDSGRLTTVLNWTAILNRRPEQF